tara:strand:- start:42407 stop:43138 length:732 start_codon:yes stop_codon:yes gene_type:complete
MKKIIIYLLFVTSIINAKFSIPFSNYELSLDTLHGNYIRIDKLNHFESFNMSISYDSNFIKLGKPIIEASKNQYENFIFKDGSLIIKSNIQNKKINKEEFDESILIPLTINNSNKSFFLSFKDFMFSGVNDKVIELRVLNGKIFIKENIPSTFQLKNNFPNPLRKNFVIRFELPVASIVDLIIYDLNGNRVRILELENDLPAGFYNKPWDGKNDMGANVSEGAYVCSIKINDNYHSMKMLLLR